MFAAPYFAARFFAPRYFPEGESGVVLTRPPYFYHGVFPARYFADRYFPGAFVNVVIEPPPEPEDTGAGRISSFPPRPTFIPPDVHVFVRPLSLAALELLARAQVQPADIQARARALRLAAVELLEVNVTVTPADIRATAQRLHLSPLELQAVVSVMERAKRQRLTGSDDDDLIDWYLTTQRKH